MLCYYRWNSSQAVKRSHIDSSTFWNAHKTLTKPGKMSSVKISLCQVHLWRETKRKKKIAHKYGWNALSNIYKIAAERTTVDGFMKMNTYTYTYIRARIFIIRNIEPLQCLTQTTKQKKKRLKMSNKYEWHCKKQP